MAQFITSSDLSETAFKAVVQRIREALHERIQEALRPDIDKAVDAALEAFKINVTNYKDFASGERVLKVIIEKKSW